jgi:hypothetical protein
MLEVFLGILIYLLMSLSIAHMWSHANIFTYARNKVAKIPYIRRPLICPECFSFWAGLGVSFIFNPLASVLYVGISNIMCGLITHLIADALYKKEILRG